MRRGRTFGELTPRVYRQYAALFCYPRRVVLLCTPGGRVFPIDLHGLNLTQAEDQLKRYLLHAQLNNKRWILVITGKGALDNPNSLRLTVPRWLDQWAMIAGYRVAKPHDGGDGSLYVWIKK